jgi:hypothetical protein
MFRRLTIVLAVAFLALPAFAEQSDKDKPLDVRSSIGDLHVGKDADAEKAGLPLYPGARPKHEEDGDPLNFAILTENMGLKLVVAKYESDDPPARIISYYRDKLKKYGKVLECHTHDDDVRSEGSSDRQHSKELKCEGDNSGPVTELKAGTEDDQHVVAIQPRDNGKTSFAIVYLHRQGKKADI